MKQFPLLLTAIAVVLMATSSCKTVAKTAFKYWTKKQVNEFVRNCETKTQSLLGDEKAARYCDCAVDVVAEKYRNYNDFQTFSLKDLLAVAEGCR